ncbi:MAG: lysophospholipid acyltransferase family protein [Actinomycetota bacterium]
MDLVYPPVIGAAKAAFRLLDVRFQMSGLERVPESGGAVLASNHVSYLDFVFAGLAAWEGRRRLVRFMAKESVFRHPVSGPLMRGMHHIPVDRAAGAGSFDAALEALRRGELVGIFPEATISRSFTVKPIKTGAVRLAQEAGVPLLPVAVWGGQRMMTKDHPRDFSRGRTIGIAVGEPVPTADGPARVTEMLRERMQALLDDVQRAHPDTVADPGPDAWWLPQHLGGTAPSPDRAAELDAAERRRRAARR